MARGCEVFSAGGNDSEICRAAGVYYYRDKFIGQVKSFRQEIIPAAYRKLMLADGRMKMSGGTKRLALERAVLEISQAASGQTTLS